MKGFAQKYVNLLVKLGTLKFSALLALGLTCLSVLVQVGVTFTLHLTVNHIDIIRSVFFGLLITPWTVFFISIVVEQLEDSRQRMGRLVAKLSEMSEKDRELNEELILKVTELNQQIKEREKAEADRLQIMDDLQKEVFEREKTQIELAERTALLRSFIDASPDLIYYRNTDSIFSGCNRAFELLAGKSEKQLVGLTPKDVYGRDIGTQIIATDQQLFEVNKPLTYEQWLAYPDGRKAYFEIRKVPFYSKTGRHLGLVGFGRDITERKEHEEFLEKISRDKTTFISTISHELRTPLNGIVGLSRMMLESQLDEQQRHYMQTISVSATTLGNIFNDIVDMDKFDREKLELMPTKLDFREFITEMESIAGLMATQKGLTFNFERLTELPNCIKVDSTRLRQVLWNLISNAVKFTQEGSVIFSVSAEVEKGQAHIQFEVEDSGIGIPESELDNIFGMYYQVKSDKDNLHAMGTGIGLAVSHQLVELMDGDLTVTSELGFGSTFNMAISVPVDKLEKQEHADEVSPLRIFMVEDIELNVTVARSLLEGMGHTVDVAMSGQEAIEKFDPKGYDIVLLDIQLPDMTGFDVAKSFYSKYNDLPPLIALTANVLKDKQEYLSKGIEDVLTKPLSVEAVVKLLSKLFKDQVHRISSSVAPDLEANVELASNLVNIIDKEMLISYIDIVGKAPVIDSVHAFKSIIPSYVSELKAHLKAKDYTAVVEEAHKIKGAAGSVGLKHIQEVAQKAQSPDLPVWEENITDWVAEIENEYPNDIERLLSWLEE